MKLKDIFYYFLLILIIIFINININTININSYLRNPEIYFTIMFLTDIFMLIFSVVGLDRILRFRRLK